MTTTYYIGTNEIVTLNSIGVSIERYHSADYWKIRLYVEDIFTVAVISTIIPNTILSISIEDDVSGTLIYSGTVGYFGTSEDYSYLDLVNCTVSFTPVA